MMWFKRLIHKWVRDASEESNKVLMGAAVASVANDSHPTVRLLKAINGTVIQFTAFTPDKRHPFDGTHESQYYVLKEGDDLVAAIATILMNEKLK